MAQQTDVATSSQRHDDVARLCCEVPFTEVEDTLTLNTGKGETLSTGKGDICFLYFYFFIFFARK